MPSILLPSHLKLHYLDHNPSGAQTVLLLHGLGVNSASWQLQLPALAQAGFRALVPDVRGFGASQHPAGNTGLPQPGVGGLAADIVHLLDAIPRQNPRVHLVGISMGGVLALQIALDRPELVEKLVLVNTFARLRPRSPRVWAFFLLRFVLAHSLGISVQARAAAGRLFPQPEQEALRQAFIDQCLQADPRSYRAAMRSLARFDARARLAEIQAPTLVVTGENDATVPPEIQAALARGIPGARQEIIPGAGHAVTAERPSQFNQILIHFLSCEQA